MSGLAFGMMAEGGGAMPWWQIPELCWLLVGTVLLLGGCWGPDPLRGRAGAVSAAFFGLMLMVALFFWKPGGEAFGGFYRCDGLAILFKRLFLFGGFIASWMMMRSPDGPVAEKIEYVALPWFAVVAMGLMASAGDFAVLFVSLETLTITSYILVSLERDRSTSLEAGVKYLIMGGLSAAFLVYGIAMLYGSCGTLRFDEMADRLPAALAGEMGPVARLGMLCVLVAVGFKVAAAPFQWWAPDVYQGAPAGLVGFMASVAKIGGFAALTRILFSGFESLTSEWAPVVAAIAALSMVLGAVMAIVQDDVRRLLAYSGVAHAGFILTGVAAGGTGAPAIWFYLAVYTIQLVGAFGVVAAVTGPRDARASFAAFAGLARRAPGMALTFSILLLGMAGLPLTSGFIAKFGVFQDAWRSGWEWLVIVAVLASVVAFYLYLRVIVVMYMQEPDEPTLVVDSPARWVLVLSAAVTVLLGVVPAPLLELAGDALPL